MFEVFLSVKVIFQVLSLLSPDRWNTFIFLEFLFDIFRIFRFSFFAAIGGSFFLDWILSRSFALIFRVEYHELLCINKL